DVCSSDLARPVATAGRPQSPDGRDEPVRTYPLAGLDPVPRGGVDSCRFVGRALGPELADSFLLHLCRQLCSLLLCDVHGVSVTETPRNIYMHSGTPPNLRSDLGKQHGCSSAGQAAFPFPSCYLLTGVPRYDYVYP